MSVPTAYLADDLTNMIADFPTSATYRGHALTITMSERTETALQGDGSFRLNSIWEIVIPAAQCTKNVPAPDGIIRVGQQDYTITTAVKSDDGVSWRVMARAMRSRGT